jgi:hypothetical protein
MPFTVPAEAARDDGANPPVHGGVFSPGQLPLPNVANTTKTTVATAKTPWMTMTGRGKCLSGGTETTRVSDEPAAAG